MSNSVDTPPFLTLTQALESCRNRIGPRVNEDHFHALTETYLLPVFRKGNNQCVLTKDLEALMSTISRMAQQRNISRLGADLFHRGIPTSITLPDGTEVDSVSSDVEISSAFYSGVRNLIAVSLTDAVTHSEPHVSLPYFPPARVRTLNPSISRIVGEQLERSHAADISRVGEFARSAHYMGSKRTLAPFLVEAVASVLSPHGTMVDLMCGSGSASAAFSRIWKTWASDAQSFCRLLAKVQGAGFCVAKAANLLRRIIPLAQRHAVELSGHLKYFLDLEDRIFHGDISPRLLSEYQDFHSVFPTYPNGQARKGWNPVREVQRRKANHKLVPYCLFTSYFANIYFGVRQSVEIDSLRYAVDQITNNDQRDWALGALVVTLSALGTTYAAHFAQPRIKGPETLNIQNLPRVLEQRAYSVIHEFSVRLLNLAEESEKARQPIHLVEGPWAAALTSLESLLPNEQILVYLDAPYSRDEYSRYYHPLETLVSYSYPSSLGTGRMPAKRANERFESEFFTRSESQGISAYADVVFSVLKRGWICAWSHSNSAATSTLDVIERVCATVPCDVRSYAAPYTHKGQGGRPQKRVTEYLLLFLPRSG